MIPGRYNRLMLGETHLSDEEYEEGWHYCKDAAFKLVGPGMPEMEDCTCRQPPQCEACED